MYHRNTRMLSAGVLLAVAASGCATMRDNPTACKIATTLAGATLGGVGGGVGVDQIERHRTTLTERAAGAAAGAAVGAAVGYVAGEFLLCPEPEPPPPPPVAAPPPPPPPARGTKIVEIDAAHFDFDRAVLKPEGERKADQAVSLMKQNPDMRVSAEGHTDSVGSDQYNLRLGERRANAVKAYLVRQGIASSRIRTESFGKAKPVAPNTTAEGRARNRRVEIIVD